MGNYSPERNAQFALARAEGERRDAIRQAERDRDFPPMERPCGTPGAIYSIRVERNTLACVVTLPFSMEESLPPEAKDVLKKELHDAILPMVERFYRSVWKHTIAGKSIDETGPMPMRWEQLFTAWIRRKLWRRETFTLDGREVWNKYQAPYEYNQPEGPFDGPRDQ